MKGLRTDVVYVVQTFIQCTVKTVFGYLPSNFQKIDLKEHGCLAQPKKRQLFYGWITFWRETFSPLIKQFEPSSIPSQFLFFHNQPQKSENRPRSGQGRSKSKFSKVVQNSLETTLNCLLGHFMSIYEFQNPQEHFGSLEPIFENCQKYTLSPHNFW